MEFMAFVQDSDMALGTDMEQVIEHSGLRSVLNDP
jgi:hypothetical protein